MRVGVAGLPHPVYSGVDSPVVDSDCFAMEKGSCRGRVSGLRIREEASRWTTNDCRRSQSWLRMNWVWDIASEASVRLIVADGTK